MLISRPVRVHRSLRTQHGLSLVELMIGSAIGLLLATWAITMFATSFGGDRKIMAEARVNQGLRAAADLIARDLRRAGYWDNSIEGTVTSSMGSTATSNPYSAVTADATNSNITYSFSRDSNDTLDSAEQFGFRLSNSAIEMKTDSSTWVAITDPGVLTMTSMAITPTETGISVGNACPKLCSAGTPNCPAITVRSYTIVLQGNYAKDSSVSRTLRTNVRVRNDQFSGVCPA